MSFSTSRIEVSGGASYDGSRQRRAQRRKHARMVGERPGGQCLLDAMCPVYQRRQVVRAKTLEWLAALEQRMKVLGTKLPAEDVAFGAVLVDRRTTTDESTDGKAFARAKVNIRRRPFGQRAAAAYLTLLDDVQPVDLAAGRADDDRGAGIVGKRGVIGDETKRLRLHLVERRMLAQRCDSARGNRVGGRRWHRG
jgi:hypothetical protein